MGEELKCATCGYDSTYEYPKHGEHEQPEKEPFIQLDGMEHQSYGDVNDMAVFACPKCGTLKIVVY